MSQDGSAGRDLVQVGRDYIRHINVNIASGNWLTAGVSLLPAIVALGLAGTGVKFAVDRSLIPLPQPEIHNNNNMYFTNLAVIEKEYKEKKGQPLQDQDLRRKIERAIDLAKEKNYQESIFLFEEIARIVQLPSIYNNLGVVYAGNENYTDAQEAYKKALELNPDFKDIYLNLGLLAEAQRKLKEAEDYYQNAPNSKKVKTRSKNIQSELKKKVHNQELEPNENIFYATPIARETTVLGNKINAEDQDFFSFVTPSTYRDIIQVRIENSSTTLSPALKVYDDEKRDISGWKYGGNSGANLEYSFVAQPNSTYYLHVSSSGRTSGNYKLTITPLKTYDEYEPNKDLFNPKPIAFGRSISAGIMDSGDQDFYEFKTRLNSEKIVVSIQNRSTTLSPALKVYDAEKRDISHWQYGGNSGANLEYSFVAQPNSTYYLHVSSWGGTNGDYTLTVKASDQKS